MSRYLLFIALALPPTLRAGDFCPLPVLKRGEPVHVSVADISQPGCGDAILEGRFVRLTQVASDVVTSAPACRPDGVCKLIRTFLLPQEREPFVPIFEWPRAPIPVSNSWHSPEKTPP